MSLPSRYLRTQHSVAMLATALIVLILSSCSVGAASQTARRVPTSTPWTVPPTVSGTLGPPPTDCATIPPPGTMTTTDLMNDSGEGFQGTVTFNGAAPAWATLGGVLQARGTPYPSTKILWVIGPNYHQSVTLTGKDLRSGAPLWFDVYGRPDTTQAVLGPNGANRGTASNSTGTWNIWGIGIIISAASCYELDVSSPTGAWRTVVAAGAAPPLPAPPGATP